MIWTEKGTKRKAGRPPGGRRLSESAAPCQERRGSMDQFAKRKRSEDSLGGGTLVGSQDSLCASTASSGYGSGVDIMCSQEEDL